MKIHTFIVSNSAEGFSTDSFSPNSYAQLVMERLSWAVFYGQLGFNL